MAKFVRACDDLVGALAAGLRSLDPAGVGPSAPADEYAPEAVEIRRRLPEATSVDEVPELIHQVMVRFFSPVDVGDASQYRELAELLWNH